MQRKVEIQAETGFVKGLRYEDFGTRTPIPYILEESYDSDIWS